MSAQSALARMLGALYDAGFSRPAPVGLFPDGMGGGIFAFNLPSGYTPVAGDGLVIDLLAAANRASPWPVTDNLWNGLVDAAAVGIVDPGGATANGVAAFLASLYLRVGVSARTYVDIPLAAGGFVSRSPSALVDSDATTATYALTGPQGTPRDLLTFPGLGSVPVDGTSGVFQLRTTDGDAGGISGTQYPTVYARMAAWRQSLGEVGGWPTDCACAIGDSGTGMDTSKKTVILTR